MYCAGRGGRGIACCAMGAIVPVEAVGSWVKSPVRIPLGAELFAARTLTGSGRSRGATITALQGRVYYIAAERRCIYELRPV